MLYVQQAAELPLYEVEIAIDGQKVAHTLSNQYYVPVPHGQWGQVADFRVVPGIGQETAELLWAAGIYGWEQAAARDLTEIVGIGKARAGAVRAYVLEHREEGLMETTYHNKVGGALDHASKTRMYRIWLASEIRRHPDQQVARQVFHLAGLVRDGHTVVISTHPNNGAGRVLARFVRWAIAEGRLPEAVPVARPADVRIHAAHDFVGANYAEEFESEEEIDLDAERLVWVVGRSAARLGYVTESADSASQVRQVIQLNSPKPHPPAHPPAHLLSPLRRGRRPHDSHTHRRGARRALPARRHRQPAAAQTGRQGSRTAAPKRASLRG